MPENDNAGATPPKKSNKRAKAMKPTSGQLREKAAKAVEAKAKKSGDQNAGPSRKPDMRDLTVEHWSRGRNDPLMTAFVSEHSRGRTVKRKPAEWMKLYRAWLSKPRG